MDDAEDPKPAASPAQIRRAALAGCVETMRGDTLTGAARDKAAKHYLAGAAAVAALFGVAIAPVGEGGYLEVLEALADTSAE